jgi:hypothetical protein
MTHQAISPLRRRMIEDMTVRTFAPKTQQLCVKGQGLRRVSRPAPRVAKFQSGCPEAQQKTSNTPCANSPPGR